MEEERGSSQRGGRVRQHSAGGDLFVIFIVNALLKLITLGIYHFWGKTRVRRYLWSQSAFDRERFEYDGLGQQLFFGFLKALGAMIPLVALYAFLQAILVPVQPVLGGLMAVLLLLGVYVLTGVGSYSARRYLLSHTRWRSIRFAQSGFAWAFAKKYLGYGLLALITLGLWWPYRRHRLLDYKVNHTWFGSERFTYDGWGGDLFARFLWTYLLTIPTLGLIWLWYLAAEYRYIARHTRLGSLQFELDYTGGQLLWLRISNWLLVLVTLGLAYPWALLRSFRFLCDRLSVTGQLEYAAIAQSAGQVPTSGEGLAEIFGVSGTLLGIGRI
ncbi:MAG: DUF898 domain-containing protein [Candidatus Tectomicrobia bacterium]|nr:DUF898 domain-containing protein [Candidatus Tectomicrobia bacterium]